jgi:hypothetical protein
MTLQELRAKNVVRAECRFFGSGDSGEIDSVEVVVADGPPVPAPAGKGDPFKPYTGAVGTKSPTPTPQATKTEQYYSHAQCEEDFPGLWDFLGHYAGQTNWDWWNNEGGGGTVEVDVSTGEVTLAGYWNETTQVDAAPMTFQAT